MISRTYHLFIDFISILLFSLILIMLLSPALNFFSSYYYHQELNNLHFLWFFLAIIISIFFIRWTGKIKEKYYSYLFIFSYILLNLVLIYFIKLPLYPFHIVFLIIISTAGRFLQYDRTDKLYTDVMMAIIFYILNILTFSIGISQIVYFLFSLVLLIIIINNRQLVDKGFTVNLRLLTVVTISLFLLILIFIILTGSNYQDLLNAVMNIVSFLYNIIIQIIEGVTYLIIRLLAPIINWFASLTPEYKPREMNETTQPGFFDKYIEGKTIENGNTGQGFNYLYWSVLIIIVIIAVYFLFRNFNSKRKDTEETGYSLERESIFSSDLLKEGLLRFFSSINPVKSRKKKKSFNLDNPIMQVRKKYYQFLESYYSLFSYKLYQTPSEYNRALLSTRFSKEKLEEKKEDINKLTELYNKARYAGVISDRDIHELDNINL